MLVVSNPCTDIQCIVILNALRREAIGPLLSLSCFLHIDCVLIWSVIQLIHSIYNELYMFCVLEYLVWICSCNLKTFYFLQYSSCLNLWCTVFGELRAWSYLAAVPSLLFNVNCLKIMKYQNRFIFSHKIFFWTKYLLIFTTFYWEYAFFSNFE